MPDEEHFRKLERAYASAPINRFFQPKLQVGDGVAEIRLEIRPEFLHAAGAAHGSVYFKALDDATFFAANSLIADVFVLTASFNIQFLRPIASGSMIASARAVHRSRRVVLAEGVLEDERGRQLARGSGFFMPSEIKLDPKIGYE